MSPLEYSLLDVTSLFAIVDPIAVVQFTLNGLGGQAHTLIELLKQRLPAAPVNTL